MFITRFKITLFSLIPFLFIALLFSFVFISPAFSTDQPPPAGPPHLQKPVDPNFDGKYLLDWSDVDCACSYKIQEADNPQFSNPTSFSVPAGASQKWFTKTIPGTFYYQVKASSNCSGIGKGFNLFFNELLCWFKDLWVSSSVYASGPCNPADINSNWSNAQSIVIVKPTSYIDGVVYQADTELAVTDAVITSPDFPGSVTSDAEGKFSFHFQTFFPESGKRTVTIDITKEGFTQAQRTVEVVATRHSAVNSIFLTPLDPVVTTITPDGGTHISSTGEIELVFPAGAVTEPTEVNSTKYQKGQALPDELPETTFFTYALNLKAETSALYKGAKKKVTSFQEPITMRVANTLGFAAGTPIPAGVYSEENKQWEDTGLMGQISADGQWLEFQIDHFSPWDLNLPPMPPPEDRNANVTRNNTQDVASRTLGCAKDPGGSLIGLKAGVLYYDVSLPQVKRSNSSFDLTLSYNSLTAQPSSLISIETDLDSVTTNIPDTTTFKASIAGREVQAIYQGVSGKVRYAYLFDGKDAQGNFLPTGDYTYSIETSNNYTNVTYATTDSFGGNPIADTGIVTIEPVPLTRKIDGNLIINNQANSSFGAGWSLQGLERLHFSPDGSILLTQGDGSAMVIDTRREPLALAANWHGWNSSVIDYQENSLIGNIPLTGATPNAVCVAPDGRHAFITHAYSNLVSLVNTTTKNEERAIDAVISQASSVNINPSGSEICVSDLSANKVRLIDALNFELKELISVGSSPCGVVYSHDGKRLYVANRSSNNISVIDTGTKQVIATLDSGSSPEVIDITNDDKYLYVSNRYSNTVSLIDVISQQIIKTINVGVEPLSVRVSPDNKYVLVPNLVSDTVSVIDTATNNVIATIPNVMGPVGVAFTPDSEYAYVTEMAVDRVAVIDINTLSVLTRINVGSSPHGIDIAVEKTLITPLGDYSTFTLNSDGTSKRVMKDGREINFNTEGLQTSLVDRNGNTTRYTYTDANSDGKQEELSQVILPTGEKYEFTYNTSGKLQSIKDPANRTTGFNIDANGDLTQITNPDNSTLNFVYDSHLLTNKTNERGFATEYQYDNYGRIKKTIASTNPQEIRQYFPSDVQGLINDLVPGTGTPTNPAPVVRPDDITERVIDGKSYTTTSQTSKFGAYAKITDALNQTTIIDRDSNNNPIKITRPNSSTVSMTYDGKGNLLTSSEDTILATTTLTYEPNFNQVTSIQDPESNLTTIEYDSKGNPVQITDALGNITKMEYNFRGLVTKTIAGFGTTLQNETLLSYYTDTYNLQSITDPLGHTTNFTYDSAGNILTTTDANNKTTTFEYDSMNRLTKVTDPDNKVTQYQYDEAGNLKKIIDAKLNETNFTYDEINQLETITNSLNKTKTFTYDLNRNLESVTDFKGQTVTFNYDEINRLTGKLANSQTIVSFGYDSVNNLTSAVDADSSLTLGYDLAGRLTSAATANLGHQPATSISSTFDKNSNRLTLTDPQSVITKYIYDALNRLTDITDASDVNISHFGYDELSRRTALSLANSTSTAYGYDLASRLLSVVTTSPLRRKVITPTEQLLKFLDDYLVRDALAVNSPTRQLANSLNSYSYTYDNVGNRLTLTDSFGTHTYGYDNLYRLTNSTLPSEAYAYDQVGNRNPVSFVYDAANRLLDDGVYTYTYDDNGNLITKTNKPNPSDITSYSYNVENQLVTVNSTQYTVSYIYDGLGRRIEKNVDGAITRYIYDNEDIIAEYDGSSTLQAKYLHGPGVDEPLRMERGGQNYFYHADGLGSITAITNSTGTTVKTYRYDAFGNIVSQTGTLANPYTYTGREYDAESGLYYYRARYYDSRVGRFLQEDPIRDYDSMSLYAYVNSNPINWADPLGLYVYSTSNWGIAFLHESNPFNADSAMRQQMGSWGKFYTGDWAGAAAQSGQSIVEKTNVCGASSGWQKWYTGSQITAGVAAAIAAGGLGYEAATGKAILVEGSSGTRIFQIRPEGGQPWFRFDWGPVPGRGRLPHWHLPPDLTRHLPWDSF